MSHTEPIFTMARYRTIVESKNGSISRLGDKKNGMTVRVNGWNIGVKVMIRYDEEYECDKIFIFRTGGSNNPSHLDFGPTWFDYTEEE